MFLNNVHQRCGWCWSCAAAVILWRQWLRWTARKTVSSPYNGLHFTLMFLTNSLLPKITNKIQLWEICFSLLLYEDIFFTRNHTLALSLASMCHSYIHLQSSYRNSKWENRLSKSDSVNAWRGPLTRGVRWKGTVTNCVGYSAITHSALRNSLQCEKKTTTLNQVCKYRSQNRHQIVIKLTSSSLKLSFLRATNTQTTNYLISLPPSFSFNFGFRIQNEEVRSTW